MTNLYGSSVSVLLGNGDGTFLPKVDDAGFSSPYGIAIGDFNRDDRLDIVVPQVGSNTVSALLGNGDGIPNRCRTQRRGR